VHHYARIPTYLLLLLFLLVDNNNPSEHTPARAYMYASRYPLRNSTPSVVDSKSTTLCDNLARYTERVQTPNDGEIHLFDLCAGRGGWELVLGPENTQLLITITRWHGGFELIFFSTSPVACQNARVADIRKSTCV
jgi:hypothetical protein